MPLTADEDELSFEELVLKATHENNMELLRYSFENILGLDNLPAAAKLTAVNQALYQASSSETTTVATIRYLIASGGNVKFTPSSGLDPSFFKIIISKKTVADKIELVNLWIENGEDINRATIVGNILFLYQSWEDETLRDFLLAKGAEPTYKCDYTGKSAYASLMWKAANHNRIDLIDYAIERINTDEKALAIHEALSESFMNSATLATIKYLISLGGDIFFADFKPSLLRTANKTVQKIEDKIEILKFLLAKGIDINVIFNNLGGNILFEYDVWEDEALIGFLLENGANPFIRDKENNTILTSNGLPFIISPSILLFMQNLGLDFDHRNLEGQNILEKLIGCLRHGYTAVNKNIFNSIKFLLEAGALNINNSLMDEVFDSNDSKDENLKTLFKLAEFTKQIYKTEIKNAETNTNFSDSDFPTEYHDFIFKRVTSLFTKLDVPNDFDKYVNDTLKHLSSEFKAGLLFAHKTAYYVNKIYDLEEPEFNGFSLEEQKDKLTALEKEQIIKLLKEKITIEGIPTKGSYNEMFYHYISEDADDLTRFIAGSFVEEMHQELVDSIELFLASYLHLVDNEHFPSPAPYSKLKASSSLEASADVIKALQSYEDKLKGSSIVKFFNNLISKSSFELTSIDEANVENYKHLNMLIKQINSNSLMPKQAKTHLKEIQKAFNLAVIKYEVNAAEALEATHADSAVLDESEDESDDGNDIAETSENAATGGAEQLHETYIPISEVSIVGDVSSS